MKREVRVVGVDDGPFDDEVLVVGTFFRGGSFMDGLVSARVERDGEGATERIAQMISESKFFVQVQYVLLSGISVAGFNMIDVEALSDGLSLPVIVVTRSMPDYERYYAGLRAAGKEDAIAMVEALGEPEPFGDVFCQYAGCSADEVEEVLSVTCTRSHVPEPLRIAHIIAGGLVDGESRGGA